MYKNIADIGSKPEIVIDKFVKKASQLSQSEKNIVALSWPDAFIGHFVSGSMLNNILTGVSEDINKIVLDQDNNAYSPPWKFGTDPTTAKIGGILLFDHKPYKHSQIALFSLDRRLDGFIETLDNNLKKAGFKVEYPTWHGRRADRE